MSAAFDRLILALVDHDCPIWTGERDVFDRSARAACPAHDRDLDHELSISLDVETCRVDLDCSAGCDEAAILDSIGLTPSDLNGTGHEGSRGSDLCLREQAYHGLAGEFMELVMPHTEADPAATLIQLLVAFGNSCGRGPGFEVESDEHGTNGFVGIVGETSKARKGTSWGHVRRLMQLADVAWAENCIRSGIASGEGLIHAVRDPVVTRRKARNKEERARADQNGRIEVEEDPGVEEKRLLVMQGELAQVLRVMKKEGNTVSPALRDLWDHGNAGGMSKGSPEKTTGSLVSLIGHITVRELRRDLTEVEFANGFANRWLWVFAKRSKKLPRGGRLKDSAREPLAAKIRSAQRFAQVQGMLDMTEDAWRVWDPLYDELSEGSDDLLGAITARAEAHVRRLAVLYALLDESSIVEVEHLRAAIAVWDYCAASAAHIFGGKVGDPLTDKILAAIRDAGEAGVNRTKIRSIVGSRVLAEQIDAAILSLVARGLVEEHVDPTTPKGGRRSHRYTLGGWSKPREGWSKPPISEVSFTGDEVSFTSQEGG